MAAKTMDKSGYNVPLAAGSITAGGTLDIPILLPVVDGPGFNLTWFAILVAVNLQAAWLSPPVALSAYFSKG